MAAQLDLNLPNFFYDWGKRGFIFQKFVNWHKRQHIIANGFMEYGYSGVYDNSKVRILVNGINTNALDACKEVILYIPEMQRVL